MRVFRIPFLNEKESADGVGIRPHLIRLGVPSSNVRRYGAPSPVCGEGFGRVGEDGLLCDVDKRPLSVASRHLSPTRGEASGGRPQSWSTAETGASSGVSDPPLVILSVSEGSRRRRVGCMQHPEKQTLRRGRDPSTPASPPLRMTPLPVPGCGQPGTTSPGGRGKTSDPFSHVGRPMRQLPGRGSQGWPRENRDSGIDKKGMDAAIDAASIPFQFLVKTRSPRELGRGRGCRGRRHSRGPPPSGRSRQETFSAAPCQSRSRG